MDTFPHRGCTSAQRLAKQRQRVNHQINATTCTGYKMYMGKEMIQFATGALY